MSLKNVLSFRTVFSLLEVSYVPYCPTLVLGSMLQCHVAYRLARVHPVCAQLSDAHTRYETHHARHPVCVTDPRLYDWTNLLERSLDHLLQHHLVLLYLVCSLWSIRVLVYPGPTQHNGFRAPTAIHHRNPLQERPRIALRSTETAKFLFLECPRYCRNDQLHG